MKKRILSVLTAAVMIFSLLPSAILAEENNVWDGQTKSEPPLSDDGVYLISDGAQLAWLAEKVNDTANSGQSYNAKLTNDIDLGEKVWTPIGTSATIAYSGIFDGNGYAVKNLNASGANSGLFGCISGTVKNLSVYGSVSGTNHAGGITGRINNGIIESCANHAEVNATGKSGCIGGIAGIVQGNSSIQSCFNDANISGKITVGGIAGKSDSSASLSITNCYNTAVITCSGSNDGGIVGYIQNEGDSVSNCYNIGIISSKSSWAGSIVGRRISGTETINSCYYLNGTAAIGIANDSEDNDAPMRKESAEMLSDSFLTLLGSAFVKDTGNINGGYPILAWQAKETPAVGLRVTDNTLAVTSNTLTGSVTIAASGDCTADILLAVYASDGTLKYTDIQPLENNSAVFSNISVNGGSTAAAFAWDSVNTMKPCADSINITY